MATFYGINGKLRQNNYLFELESGHAVEELGEMLGDGGRVVSVGQDVEQIGGRYEVEPREGQTFRLQVLSQCLLTQSQTSLKQQDKHSASVFSHRAKSP